MPTVFISHASEDKTFVARPLAEALTKENIDVWYDEYSLRIGDSLKTAIDRGLAESDFGVVILSKAFFSKRWTRDELDGLVSRETGENRKIILPIWHEIDRDYVAMRSPSLAGKVALQTSMSINELSRKIASTVRTEFTEQFRELQMISPYGGKLSLRVHCNGSSPEQLQSLQELLTPEKSEKMIKVINNFFENNTHLRKVGSSGDE